MNETVLLALMSLTGTLCGTLGGIITTSKLTNYRIEQLDKKVEKHNNLIERTFKLEERQSVAEQAIKTVSRRIDDMERR